MAKSVEEVDSADRIGEIVARAIRIARRIDRWRERL